MKKYDFIISILSLLVCLTACEQATKTPNDVFIYGIVQDKLSGEWLDNVEIHSDSMYIGNVVTGFDGYFALTIRNTKKMINLKASKHNYETETQLINVYELSKNPNKSIDFQLLRSSIIYTGVVVDAISREPIANAKVHAKIQNGAYIGAVGTVFTNQNGLYTLELSKPEYESWKYYITADASGYNVQTYTLSHTKIDIGKNFVLDFQLQTK